MTLMKPSEGESKCLGIQGFTFRLEGPNGMATDQNDVLQGCAAS